MVLDDTVYRENITANKNIQILKTFYNLTLD